MRKALSRLVGLLGIVGLAVMAEGVWAGTPVEIRNNNNVCYPVYSRIVKYSCVVPTVTYLH